MSDVVVVTSRRDAARDLRDLWAFRELVWAFALRDVKVRYKQTIIGVVWALIQPVVTMVIYAITFGRVAKMPSDGIPYPLFSYVGVLFWTLFATSLTSASTSLINNDGIVKKAFFPRLALPLSSVAVSLVDFVFSTSCLFGLMAYFHVRPTWIGVLALPVLAAWTALASLGLGIFLAALNAKFRDVRYALPFFIQLAVFVSPVIYPAAIFRGHAWILALNPMTGVIEAARYLLFGAGTIDAPVMMTSILTSVVSLLFGYAYFVRSQQALVDIL
ncbi:MAG: ABC transporter permease [Polyangiales bacterium]